MKITSKVTDIAYTQWVEQFVQEVLEESGLCGEEVVIMDIEPDKRIFITVDGLPHDIRTWGFIPVETDENGKPCAEDVQYTLFQMVEDEDGGGHGDEVDSGTLKIEWTNEENENQEDTGMNKTIEAIKQGEHVEIIDLFELVNQFKITMLSVSSSGIESFSMDVNTFEKGYGRYEFRQEQTTNNYFISASDIVDTEAKYVSGEDGFDSINISCTLKNGGNLSLYVFKVSQYESEAEAYTEIDFEELKNYLDNFRSDGGTYINVCVDDLHGLHLKIPMVDFADIEEDENEDFMLYVGGGSGELKVSLYDDSCNTFYKKKTGVAEEFIIRPYGQPFTEIIIQCFKKKSE